MTLQEQDKAYIANTYARYNLTAVSGKGAVCKDESGKEYIDFSSGIGVNALGFCDDAWVKAVCAQAQTIQHISNLYHTEPMVQLAKTLCERTMAHKVFFSNSGAEANEGMIKAARKYSFDRYGKGRHTIICLQNSFHGRTITTLSATGQQVFHKNFDPFTEGFVFAQPNQMESIYPLIDDTVCGIMVELVQGEGGVIPLEQGFVAEIARICKEKDILLLVDEVQTGIGRTGRLLCSEHYGITPNVVSLAKGLGGGLPIGAVLLGEKCASTLGAGDHATTYGGNPIACAGANAVLERLDEAFLKEVEAKGVYITEKLKQMPHVVSVAGKGMMLGVTLGGLDSRAVVSACLERGLVVLTAKEKLRLLPPLTITQTELDAGLKRLNEVLSQ